MFRKSVFIFVLLVITYSGYTQGCSDAGFCTMNSFKPHSAKDTGYLNKFSLGLSMGQADKNISVWGQYAEYVRSINKKLSLGAKLTALSQQGNGVSTFGLSDIFLNANYRFHPMASATLGCKVPFSSSNKKENSISLPMDYQSSLGTFDLILGVNYQVKKFQFSLAYQQPLTQNKNEFESKEAMNPLLIPFQTTRGFKRSGDVLFRVSYMFKVNEHLAVTPGILPIYHLIEDSYLNDLNQRIVIRGSDGLTLNGNVNIDYVLNHKHALQLSLASPFIVREKRPDGLTRSFLATLEYSFRF